MPALGKLNLKKNEEVKEIDIGGVKIKVKQYLPTSDKVDLMEAAIAKAGGNNFLEEVYFYYYLVLLYTDITITQKQQENELKLYDLFNTNGIIEQVLEVIPTDEFSKLYDAYNALCESAHSYSVSTGGAITALLEQLPKTAQDAAKAMEEFDPQKYKQVMELAERTGMKVNSN